MDGSRVHVFRKAVYNSRKNLIGTHRIFKMLKKSTLHNNGQSILSINGHDVNYVFFYCQNLEKGFISMFIWGH